MLNANPDSGEDINHCHNFIFINDQLQDRGIPSPTPEELTPIANYLNYKGIKIEGEAISPSINGSIIDIFGADLVGNATLFFPNNYENLNHYIYCESFKRAFNNPKNIKNYLL
ncbi:MAG: hypothetical protein N4A38_00370 [Candidatus Gracilibacteria bacterium]|nr:hypothetical protein [Candidatus Gracilibacteria bacterium]